MTNSNSATFLGSSIQYASVARDSGIHGGACSISLWIKPTSQPTNNGSQWYIAEHRDATNHIQNVLRYTVQGGTASLNFLRGKLGIANQSTSVNTTLSNGTWYHIVGTYDGANLNLYLNGSLVAGPTAASGDGSTATVDYFAIGTDGDTVGPFTDNGTGRQIDAELDEVIFFNADIGATRAANLHSSPCSPDTTNAISRYPLDNDFTDPVGSHTLTAGSGSNSPTFTTDIAFTCATTPIVTLAMMGIGKR